LSGSFDLLGLMPMMFELHQQFLEKSIYLPGGMVDDDCP